MLENQNGSLAGNARNLSKNKFVCNQVPDKRDRHLGKRFNDPPEPLGLLMIHTHLLPKPMTFLSTRFSHAECRRSLIMRSMVSTALAASISSILTGSTVRGWRAKR